METKQTRTRIDYSLRLIANLGNGKQTHTAQEIINFFVDNNIAPDQKNARVTMGKFITRNALKSTMYDYTVYRENK